MATPQIAPPPPREITTEPRTSDKVFRAIVTAGGMASLVVLGLILLFLSIKGIHILSEQGLNFITKSNWEVITDENGDMQSANFGVAAMLIGTFLCAVIAVLVGVPISVLSSIYLVFFAKGKIRSFLISAIDLMAAFPSLLYGFWGFFVFMSSGEYWAKLIHKYLGFIPFFDVPAPIFERSPFIAGLVLAIMIIPITTSVSREVFNQTPLDRIQAAYALGSSKFLMIRHVALPFARSGIIGGAMLGLGRAMGETVAVYTVLNVVYQINWHILFGAGGNIASLILLKFGEAGPYEVDALMAAGLILFILTLLVNAIADFIINKFGKDGR